MRAANGHPRGRPRILFLTAHLPYPPVSGGRLREFELLARLSQIYDVHLRVVSKTYAEDAVNRNLLLDRCTSVSVFPAEQVTAACAQMAAHGSRGLRKSVTTALSARAVDLIHAESFYMAQHVPHSRRVPLLLVAQNVEHLLWRQRWQGELDRSAARDYFLEEWRTREAEAKAWREADLCAAVSEEDQAQIEGTLGKSGVRVVPCGWEHILSGQTTCQRVPATGNPLITLVGNFSYQPSRDAAQFLCAEILPRVLERLPLARLVLVGNDANREVEHLASKYVMVTGRVPDVRPWLKKADIVVSPIRVGGGVKVKVLEALGLGKPLVTTSVGAQGLGQRAHRAMRIADSASDFAAEVVALGCDPGARVALSRAARLFVAGLPTWDDAAAALSHCYSDLLERSQRANGSFKSVSDAVPRAIVEPREPLPALGTA
jgi:glycosyltransferase involved in cell wall biosynthesis